MRSCDTCPGGADCAAVNLHPILLRVHSLYASGMTDKFDILFSLGEESEALLERHDDQVSKVCWTKAALLAMADIISNGPEEAADLIASAVASFEHFPWQITELVEQAPDLYGAIIEQVPQSAFADTMSKRDFVKICKAIAYADKS